METNMPDTSSNASIAPIEGVHHISAITGDAAGNVDFYARVMGLRMVKKTVNQDDPSIYHLFYADEKGSPGADMTFFDYPGARPGRAGAGMVHQISWRVASADSLDYWAGRLDNENVKVERADDSLTFADHEGLGHRLVVDTSGDEPLIARHLEVPAEHAIRGFDGVRAYTTNPESSRRLLADTLGFEESPPGHWQARGSQRGGTYTYDNAPADRAVQGGGTVHHVAWSVGLDEIAEWQKHVSASAPYVTEVIDRFYFKSVYFREPSGVLFELASRGPGFTSDEPLESLGEVVSLPPAFESARDRIIPHLQPLPDATIWRPKDDADDAEADNA